MSSSIDERIVQMQFDNKQFEEGVKETSHTLENFKKALKLDGAEKGFQEIENASKKVKLSGISAAVDEINHKFSLMGVAAATAVQNLTNKVVNSMSNMLNSVTVGPINQGFSKYEEKLKSTQVIMNAVRNTYEGTEPLIDHVSKQLDRILLFTDETSYSFTDMVNNIGKFTASNVKLDDSVTAMQGISTWAAKAGASVQEAGRAMYNLSQSIGMGYVAAMDWKSIENANMATAEFKQVALDAAVAVGSLKKKADGLYETLDGKEEVTVENFRNTLQKKWFTSEALIKALDEYGRFADVLMRRIEETDGAFTASEMTEWIKAYKEGEIELSKIADETGLSMEKTKEIMDELSDSSLDFSRNAFEAAYEARTFGDAIAATVDAVSSKWMTMFELLFGNYEKAKKLWTDLAISLWDIFAGPIDEVNYTLKEWAKEGGQDSFLRGLYALGRGVYNIIMLVRDAWSEIFPPKTAQELKHITDIFADFAEKFEAATEYGKEFIEEVAEKVSEPFKEAKEEIEEVAEAVGMTTEKLDEFANAVIRGLYGNGEDRVAALREMGLSYELIQNRVNELLGISYRYEVAESDLIEETKDLIEVNDDAAESIEKVDEALEETSAEEAAKEIEKLSISFDETVPLGAKLHDTLKGMFAVIKIVSDAIGSLTRIVIMPLINWALPRLLNIILSVTQGFGKWFTSIYEFIHTNNYFEDFFTTIVEGVKTIKESVENFIEKIKNLESVQAIIKHFTDFITFLSGVKDDTFSGVSNIFAKFSNLGKDNKVLTTFVDAFDWLMQSIDSFIKMMQPVTNYISGLIGSVTSWLNTADLNAYFADVGKGAGRVFEALKLVWDFFAKNSFRTKDWIQNMTLPDAFNKMWGSLMSAAYNMDTYIKIFKEFVKDLFEGFDGLETVQPALDTFAALGEKISVAFAPVGTVLSYVSPIISSFFKMLGNALDDFSLYTLLDYIRSGVLIAAIGAFALTITKLGKVFGGIEYMFEEIGGTFKAFKRTLQANTILKIALAFVALAGAFYLIAQTPVDQLKMATIAFVAISGCLVILMGVMGALSHFIDAKDFAVVASGIIALAGAILMIAGALVLISNSTITEEAIWLTIGIAVGLVALVIAMSGVMKALMSTQGDAMKAVAGMAGIFIFALSIQKIVQALVELSEADLDAVKKALPSLFSIILMLALVSALAGKAKFGGGFSLIAAVISLWLFVKVLEGLGNADWNKIKTSIHHMIEIFILLGVLAVLANIGGNGLKGLGAVFAGLAFALIAASIAIKILSGIDLWGLAKGAAIVAGLIFLLGAFAMMAQGSYSTQLWQLSLVFIALGVTLILIAGAIALLSMLHPGKAFLAAVEIVALIYVIGLMVQASKGVEKGLPTLITLTVMIAVLAAAIWALAILPWEKTLAASTGLFMVVVAMAALVLAVGTIKETSIAKAIVIMGVMALLLVAIAAVIAYLANEIKNPDAVIPIAEGLALLLGSLAAVVAVLSKLNVDIGEIQGGILAMGEILALIVAIAGIVGALDDHFKGVIYKAIEKGLDILVMIGRKLGEFVGAILGGVVEGFSNAATEGIINLANGVSNFVEALGPLQENLKNLKEEDLAKIEQLEGFLTALSGIDFSQLSGDGSAEKASQYVTNVANAIKSFNAQMKEVENIEKAELAADILEILDSITFENNVNWWNIGSGLPEFATQLANFTTNLSSVDEDSLKKARTAAGVANTISKIKPIDNGFWGSKWREAGTAMSQMAEGVLAFAAKFENTSDYRMAGFDRGAEMTKKLVELQKAIPINGGISSWFTGSNNWQSFGSGLMLYGETLVNFAAAVEGLTGKDVATVSKAVLMSTKLVELKDAIPKDNSFFSLFTGYGNWQTFGSGLAEFGTAVKGFADSVIGINTEGVEAAVTASKQLAEVSIDETNVSLATFGANLERFSEYYKTFVANMEEAGSTDNLASVIGAFGEGFEEALQNVEGVAQSMVELALSGITDTADKFLTTGTAAGLSYIDGLKSADTESAGNNIASEAIKGATDVASYGAWQRIGTDGILGFIDGLKSKVQDGSIYAAGTAIGNAALTAAKRALDENSPSKKMAQVGSFAGEGFVNGLLSWLHGVDNAATTLGEYAVDGAGSALQNINSFVDDLTNPVIRPTLDLSGVASNAAALNGMINRNAMIRASIEQANADRMNTLVSRVDKLSDNLENDNRQYTFETHVDLNGREIARGTANYMNSELNRIEKFNNRRDGIK